MVLDSYAIIYLLSNAFGVYVIYRFLHVFFDERKTDFKTESKGAMELCNIDGVFHTKVILYNP